MMKRRNWEETCAYLRSRGHLDDDLGFLGPNEPRIPDRTPSPDDEEGEGIALYKGGFAPGEDLSNLTLPRTFVGRSRLEDASFANSDLSESWLCWNTFEDVNFSAADMRRCDMRSSEFVRARFDGADLSGSDLRRSTFDNCSFVDTIMTGVKLTRDQADELRLSAEQARAISWADSHGEEPLGG